MKSSKLHFATAVAGLAMIASLAVPGASQASTKGKRNTTILLGAGAAYELLHHKTTNGLILGAGTAYAYNKYNQSRKRDKRIRTYRRVVRHRTVRHRSY